MIDIVAIAVAAFAAIAVSMAWYAVFGAQVARLTAAGSHRPAAWKMLVELGRGLLLGTALAGFAAHLQVVSWTGGATLGAAAWTFAAWLYAGSVLWAGVPWRLAAIHAGDALVKMVVVAAIVAAWN